MNWKTVKPTKPGYYWYKRYPNSCRDLWEVVKVYQSCDDLMVLFLKNMHEYVVDKLSSECQWAGPIEEPE